MELPHSESQHTPASAVPLPTAVAEKGPAPLTESAEMCGDVWGWQKLVSLKI